MRDIFLIIALLAATAVVHSQNEVKPEKTRDMSADITNHKQAVTILFEKCFNQGQIELLPDLIATDYQGPNGESGPSAFTATITGVRVVLPDVHYTLENVVAEGGQVAVRWRLEGTQDGIFRGFAASHNHVKSSGMAFFEFKGGRIERSWILTDQLGFLQQIGALPAAIKPPERP
jgi:predicted ester cyclase